MDKIGEQLNPETKPVVKIIELDSGEEAKVYKNHIIFQNGDAAMFTDNLKPHDPKCYIPGGVKFALENGAIIGPNARNGSWKKEDDPVVIKNLQKIVGFQN
jgi:hypothetical protein